jgi:hypothetical protein
MSRFGTRWPGSKHQIALGEAGPQEPYYYLDQPVGA